MTEPAPGTQLTHVQSDGSAHMVDVSAKPSTARTARALSTVQTTPEVTELLAQNGLAKGDALGTARIAGIMAAKRTPDLVPLCHPLPVAKVTVDLKLNDPAPGNVLISAEVKTTGPTGVEMEALTAVSVAALTLYDMIKGVDRSAVIAETKVVTKSGGASGDWSRA
jgi:cyclic pyranopterin monophosphate synthase